MSSLDVIFGRASGDRRHGAAEIERRLVTDLLDERRRWDAGALNRGAVRLLTGQPAMANLRNLARSVRGAELKDVEDCLRRRLIVLRELDERLATAAWPRIASTRLVLTVSRSSAVAAVLFGAWDRGWRGRTVVFDGSPAGGGVNQAERLAERMGHVVSQPDAAVVNWLDGDGSLVLIGADAVSPERIVNVSGTRAMLELAAARKIPVAVVADSGKDLPDDELEEILASVPTCVDEGPARRWPIFEAVPSDLVTERISE